MIQKETEYIEQGQVFMGSVPYAMGTRFGLLLCGVPLEKAQRIWNHVALILERLDAMLNRFSPSSEVSILNSGASIQGQSVSAELYAILELAADYYEKTEGLFDVTKGHMKEIEFPEPSVVSLYGNSLDFGGFAKGYFLRKVKEILRDSEIVSAYADFGGSSILALGTHPYGDCWKVGLTDPFTGRQIDEISLKDMSLSTSGNTSRYSGHIVNPLDGSPDGSKKLSTVVSPDPLDAEVLSTALFIASEKESELIVSRFEETSGKIYNL